MSAPGLLETMVAEDFIHDRLAADATLMALLPGATADNPRVASPIAPEVWGDGPFVTFQLLDPRDVRGVGTTRIMATALYIVKAVAKTRTWDTVRPVAERIDVLLNAASGTAAGGSVLHIARESVYQVPETVAADQWRHLGGTYKVWAQ